MNLSRIYTKAAARTKNTARIEQVEQMGNVARIVLAFSSKPNGDDIERVVAGLKGFEAVPNSFTSKSTDEKVVAGFLRSKSGELNINDIPKTFKEVAANVYMDESDNGIWRVVGGSLVRTQTEDLAELVAIASAQATPANVRAPLTSLASIRPFAGAANTQIVMYVSPERAEVIAGFRVSEDEVWSPEEGLTEVAEDQVVDTEQLNGTDIEDEETAKKCTASTDVNEVIDYYSQLYAYNPVYMDQVIEQVKQRSIY